MHTRRPVRLAAGALAAFALVLLTAAPAAAAPAVEVTPDSDLVDFQEVTVSGSGYTPNTTVGIVQCVEDAGSQENCDLSMLTLVTTDGTGAFTSPFVVERLIDTSLEESFDCAPSACAVGAGNISDFSEAASAPLHFDPDVPAEPRLAIELGIEDRGSFTRPGDAVIGGTVVCNVPATVSLSTTVEQRAGRSIITGSGFTSFICDGETEWTATTEFTNGVFRGGHADVQVFASGFTGNMFDDDTATSTVKLRGKPIR